MKNTVRAYHALYDIDAGEVIAIEHSDLAVIARIFDLAKLELAYQQAIRRFGNGIVDILLKGKLVVAVCFP